jgi:Tol biopolymer transport system component
VSVSLSPDGKKIAFWLHAQPSPYEEPQLAVLNLETQQVINYCIPGLHHGNTHSPVWSPAIWSLDSHYLAVLDQYEPNAGRAILVDTRQGSAAQVAELIPNGWPAGWMVPP